MIATLLIFVVSGPSNHSMNRLPPVPRSVAAPDTATTRARVDAYRKAMKALSQELQAVKAADGGQLSEAHQREFLTRVNAINDSFGVKLVASPPPTDPTPR